MLSVQHCHIRGCHVIHTGRPVQYSRVTLNHIVVLSVSLLADLVLCGAGCRRFCEEAEQLSSGNSGLRQLLARSCGIKELHHNQDP